eukprot:scaffold94767_cov37-Tisochrysis_lutea.AAC.1
MEGRASRGVLNRRQGRGASWRTCVEASAHERMGMSRRLASMALINKPRTHGGGGQLNLAHTRTCKGTVGSGGVLIDGNEPASGSLSTVVCAPQARGLFG